MAWYRGQCLRNGAPVYVPAPLVDYPPTDEQAARLFDPSRRGRRCHATPCVRNALLEIVERDAVMSAWGAQAPLPRIDLDQAEAVLPASPATRQLRELLAVCREIGLEPAPARIPTAVSAWNAWCVGPPTGRRGSHSLRWGADSGSLDESLAGALREALQVRNVLIGVRSQYADRPAPSPFTGDLDRAGSGLANGPRLAFGAWTALARSSTSMRRRRAGRRTVSTPMRW